MGLLKGLLLQSGYTNNVVDRVSEKSLILSVSIVLILNVFRYKTYKKKIYIYISET